MHVIVNNPYVSILEISGVIFKMFAVCKMDVSLKVFLKKHSVIPNAFIDNFLSMYNPDTVQTDFVIDADNVSQWLNIPKFIIIKTLKESYKDKIDYIITKSIKPNLRYGGNNYKKVMLTPDCFKRLCMRSRTKRAEEVRTYFIQLESLLVKYKSFIIDGMQQEEKRLQQALKPKDPNDKAGYIYVIRASNTHDSVYKIGRTQNLQARLKTYNSGTLDGVEVVFKFRTDSYKKTEACLKVMLKEHQLRKYKEVYQVNIDIIKTIIGKCDDTAQYIRVWTNSKASTMTGGYYAVLDKDE